VAGHKVLRVALPLPKKKYGDDTAKHGKIWAKYMAFLYSRVRDHMVRG